MLFRQFFDAESCTYTYLIASRLGGEAVIVDSVLEHVDQYLRILEQLDLKLVKVVDTHTHADHITAMGALRDRTKCVTVMGDQSAADVVSMRVSEGEKIDIEGLSLDVLYTPGHTDDSYTFRLPDRILTGDTLFIRGTGRTDFPKRRSGSAARSRSSINSCGCPTTHWYIRGTTTKVRRSAQSPRNAGSTRACRCRMPRSTRRS